MTDKPLADTPYQRLLNTCRQLRKLVGYPQPSRCGCRDRLTFSFGKKQMPQKTIKQWCSKHQINWYGQGCLGSIRYDWKLAFGGGRSAFFSSGVSSATPAVQELNGKPMLVFPNVNSSRRNGMISEAAFLRIIDWVQRCLDGEVSEPERH